MLWNNQLELTIAPTARHQLFLGMDIAYRLLIHTNNTPVHLMIHCLKFR